MSGETISIVLAGVGGQGILLASTIIARAALAAGYQVKTNEVHGMAQRGGSVLAQVRYGHEVYSPLITEGTAQVLATFEEIEALRFAHYLAPEGLAVVSTQQIVPVTVSSGKAQYPADAQGRIRQVFPRVTLVDAPHIAAELGNPKVMNVVVLGALSHGVPLPEEAWEEAISRCVPEKHLELNRRAFAAGRAA